MINLERSADRRKFMEIHLSEFPELDCHFVNAVDGKILTPEELTTSYDEAKALHHLNNPLNSGEIGCALSHINCYSTITAENKNIALILEDDIIMSSDFPALIPSLSQWLISVFPRVVLLKPARRYWRWPARAVALHYQLHKACKKPVSTAAYLINTAAADILKKNLFPVYTVADDWRYFSKKFGIDVRTVIPHCVSFRRCSTLASTIGTRQGNPRQTRQIRRLQNLWYRILERLGLIQFGGRLW